MVPYAFKYQVHCPEPLDRMVRLLRALPEQYRGQVVGITGDIIGLACANDLEHANWLRAWREVYDSWE